MKIRKNVAKLGVALMLTTGLGVAGAASAQANASCTNHVHRYGWLNADKWEVFKVTPTNCYSYHYKFSVIKLDWVKQSGYGVCWRNLPKGRGGC